MLFVLAIIINISASTSILRNKDHLCLTKSLTAVPVAKVKAVTENSIDYWSSLVKLC